MGLLDSVIGGVLGQVLGGGRGGQSQGGAMSPIVKALLMLLLAKGASGGLGGGAGGGLGGALGEILGGGRPAPEADRPDAGGREPDRDGDLGGFGAPRGHDDPLPPGDYSDLSGMLDGPGDAVSAPRSGNVSHDMSGGLDGLVDSFRRGGLGDVMDSWIGHGTNRPIASDDLARALGPDTLDTLQSRTGMDRGSLLSQLAQVLPEVVHGLTPQGRMPEAGERRGW